MLTVPTFWLLQSAQADFISALFVVFIFVYDIILLIESERDILTVKKETKIKKKNNVLIDMIKSDTKLDEEQRMSYISLANLYLEKFDEYINKTSIDINKDIPLGVDTWRDFLNYPVVRKYVQSFRDEQIMQVADTGLMKGDKNAIGIKKVMQDNGPAINNSNLILIRIPEKVDFD